MQMIIDFLSNILNHINLFVNDWGITIIVVTLLIKVLLIPMTIKQRRSMELQQKFTKQVDALKKKYKHDKKRLDQEMAKLSSQFSGNMMGCLLTFVQLPIMISLYRAISHIPIEIPTTVLLPWISNIKAPDGYFLIPIISLVIHLMPNMLHYLSIFKELDIQKPNKTMIIITLLMNVIFISQAPVIIGIYWIISGLYSFLEQFVSYWIKAKKLRVSP
ncbi:membrane protein insertase YidC [Vallitalea pronyensis]|uniref:Membrane protein insertase YidC n=1 Tax=Vallitalea pronyensis TaxID=1348613 RepID=A0A8J8MKZ3_9FIRM|nr:membrane protein insertase YidC [Vallitalea pronyensis]QUI23610.1 membrane protein insertase YidC [Vallitalea pronyensis]